MYLGYTSQSAALYSSHRTFEVPIKQCRLEVYFSYPMALGWELSSASYDTIQGTLNVESFLVICSDEQSKRDVSVAADFLVPCAAHDPGSSTHQMARP